MSTPTPGVPSGGVSGAGQALQDHTNPTEPTVAVGSLSEYRATKVTVVGAGLVKHLADLADGETPQGFRDFTAEQIPMGYRVVASTGNIVPDDMSSGSHSAERVYFKVVNGNLVGIDDDYACAMEISTVVESDGGGEVNEKEDNGNRRERDEPDEEQEETQEGKKQKLAEDKENEDDEDGEDDEEKASPYQWKTKCGIVAGGVTWSGNSQCYCDICSGVADSDDEAEK